MARGGEVVIVEEKGGEGMEDERKGYEGEGKG